MKLAYGFSFKELNNLERLTELDYLFLQRLKEVDLDSYRQLLIARKNQEQSSDLIIKIAPVLEDFIADFFMIEQEVEHLQNQHHQLLPINQCKKLFIQRVVAKKYPQISEILADNIYQSVKQACAGDISELNFAKAVLDAQQNKDLLFIEQAQQYAAWAMLSVAGKKLYSSGTLFKQPKKLDYALLVRYQQEIKDDFTVLTAKQEELRKRYGFKLTDSGADLQFALDQTSYCIFCHHQNKDSCSKGLREKDHSFKTSPLATKLIGCPLEEKISEMNEVKSNGWAIGALAIAVIDNPMLAATGHRICNDCMKSCIYQKQEPVNIPQIETRILKDVLELPWGFEIYCLLTRWNPLNILNPLPKPASDYKILVAGMGPAGFTLTHYLLQEGHKVVGIDGLKIEEFYQEYLNPIKDINKVFKQLDERVLAGFGGVAEYGITVRWNKNFLLLIRILLERRSQFRLIGGVRLGSNITPEQVFALGFDHLALALGAGKPNLPNIPNIMARGVRTASDFLMSLQLTGSAKQDSIANLQIRMPIVVIGGGLTAIDTATESLAYYQVQVEKFLSRFEQISSDSFKFSEEEVGIAKEFITHAQALRKDNDYLKLIKEWGGVKVLYRKALTDAPCYRNNSEEVDLAFQEGIEFVEHCQLQEIITDKYGHVAAVKVMIDGQIKQLPAKTVLLAIGTNPNTVLSREYHDIFTVDQGYFQALNNQGQRVAPEKIAKPQHSYVLTSSYDDRFISYFGDLHPSYAGNVVKAMASAKNGYPIISNILKTKLNPIPDPEFLDNIKNLLTATVTKVVRLTSNIVEIVVKSPLAATNFQPGQFYRLQNYQAYAYKSILMEGIALTGAWVDKEQGLIGLIALEMGGSSNLLAYLKAGEKVVLMGPTGTATEIVSNEQVLLIGGGLGNAVLFSIGKALRAAGSKVLYVAGYKKLADRYKCEEIEQAADQIIWCCDEGLLAANRPQDKTFQGNIIQAITHHAEQLRSINRIIAIGSDIMMSKVAEARASLWQAYLPKNHIAIASINSPMQCMMKEICAQCLQKHVDHESGKEYYVYSCFNQDQPQDQVDFNHLNQRLKQNSVQEKATNYWLKSQNI